MTGEPRYQIEEVVPRKFGSDLLVPVHEARPAAEPLPSASIGTERVTKVVRQGEVEIGLVKSGDQRLQASTVMGIFVGRDHGQPECAALDLPAEQPSDRTWHEPFVDRGAVAEAGADRADFL